MRAYDQENYQQPDKSGWHYPAFRAAFTGCDPALTADWNNLDWKKLKVWSCTRVLGRWPLPLFDIQHLPRVLECCPLCALPHVDLSHVLASCVGTSDLRRLHQVVGKSTKVVIDYLFRDGSVFGEHGILGSRVCYVYDVFEAVAESLLSSSDIETFINQAARGP